MKFWEEIPKTKVLEKLSKYRNEKRLQGFLQHKIRNRFKRLKTAVRKLKLGVEPPNDVRNDFQVNSRSRVKLVKIPTEIFTQKN